MEKSLTREQAFGVVLNRARNYAEDHKCTPDELELIFNMGIGAYAMSRKHEEHSEAVNG